MCEEGITVAAAKMLERASSPITDLSPPCGRCLTVNDFKLTLGSVARRRSNRITPAVIVTDRSPTLMLLAMVLLIAHDMKPHLSKTLDVQVFYKL